MLKKLWLMVCFGLLAITSQAQQTFTPQECEAFVQQYFAEKEAASMSRSNTLPPLEKYSVSTQRYAEIFRAQLNEEPILLSTNEKALLADLAKTNKILDAEKQVRLENAAAKYSLPTEKYQAILQRYNAEIKFQRSLKPYFDNYLQNQKGR